MRQDRESPLDRHTDHVGQPDEPARTFERFDGVNKHVLVGGANVSNAESTAIAESPNSDVAQYRPKRSSIVCFETTPSQLIEQV